MLKHMMAGAAILAAGFLLGSQIQPEPPLNSQLADAQVVAQDRDVRWIGYHCGDDGATVIAREMPNIMECKEVRRLSEEDEFPMPPKRIS